jgi:hypothetical protein
MRLRSATVVLVLLALSPLSAKPPEDPQARKVYDHNKEWLKKFPASFVATNIRGQGMQYAERRMAALDVVREQRDFGVVSELVQALKEKSFLSSDIIDILVDWKARRAIPVLKEIAEDPMADAVLREQAKKAAQSISNAPVDKPPVY